jgi:uncharacterized protein
LVAGATCKKDGIVYLVGVVFGIIVFSELFTFIEPLFYGGYLGDSFTLDKLLGIRPGIVAFFVLLMAIGGFWGAEILEKKFNNK